MFGHKKGLLIVVEGIDGSGKSTLLSNLYTKISQLGLPVLATKEPGGTAVGKSLRQLLLDQHHPLMPKAEYLLFAADHAQHIQEIIVPELAKRTIILSDRMADSAYAYQGYGRNIDKKMIPLINNWIMEGLEPDMTIYVTVPIAVALERINKRGASNTFEKHHFLERVVQGFQELYKDRTNLITIDGTQSPEQMTEQAYEQLAHHFKDHFPCNKP